MHALPHIHFGQHDKITPVSLISEFPIRILHITLLVLMLLFHRQYTLQ